jgi:polysaccharide pyruvyl transferase WcaK-like protein
MRKCAKVFARGQGSFEATQALDLGDTLGLAPDIAFSFRAADSLTDENPDYEREIVERLLALRGEVAGIVALSVSSVVHKKCAKRGINYVKVMSEVSDGLVERGLGVLVYPNATREATDSLHNNDLLLVREIAAGVSPSSRDRVVPIERDLNTASLRAVLVPVDWMLASRFHAMIAGLSMAKPIMVLGWGHKYEEVLQQFGIEQWCFDFADLRTDFVLGHVDRFLAAKEEIRASIEARLPEVRAGSASQFEWLSEFLSPDLDAYSDDEGDA